MKVLQLDKKSKYDAMKPYVLAMGMFDGLHLGHIALIEEAVKLASMQNMDNDCSCAVLTFDISPKQVFGDGKFAGRLLSNEMKLEMLERLGVDITYIMQFTSDIFSMSPKQFFEEIIIDKISPKVIVVGFNYTFGKNKSGNIEVLKDLCQENDIELKVIEPVEIEGDTVSSTRIKLALAEKNVRSVSQMLGREYEIEAVAKEQNILQVSSQLIIPSEGTYEIEICGKSLKCKISERNTIEICENIFLQSNEIYRIKFV